MEKKDGGYQLGPNDLIMVRVDKDHPTPTMPLSGPIFVRVLDQQDGVIHISTDTRGERYMDAPDFAGAVQVKQDTI